MKNINELRHELCVIFDNIRDSKVALGRAKELTNTAGKIINSIKVELVYAALRKEVPVIDFLGGNLGPDDRNKMLGSISHSTTLPMRRAGRPRKELKLSAVA